MNCWSLCPSFGLARLYEPSAGDIFFDLEGDPLVGENGLEYLFGYRFQDVDGQERYVRAWALSRAQERVAFEQFIDFVMDRLNAYPDLHIYHYALYEPAALKRLMGRYATHEDERSAPPRKALCGSPRGGAARLAGERGKLPSK
jgi:predicted RecB family nuclease